jgi:hypothetical protein
MTRARSWLARYTQGRFFFLLMSILLLLLLQPFLEGFELGQQVLRLFFVVTLGTALYSISDNRRRTVCGLAIGLPAVIVLGSSYFVDDERLIEIGFLVTVAFLIFVAINVLRYVLESTEVTAETIFAALSVYLLFGLIWASGYFVLELFQNGSLQLDGVDLSASVTSREGLFSKCLYYSYVTLTTLGYGDVKPTTPPAQSLSYVQALTGQLYLAVLVARLVALQITSSRRK